MVKDTILYDRLRVKTDASEIEIKKSYINLSKINHPDKQPEEMKEQATKTFKELLEAKEVLMDSEKRNLYDQIGMDLFKQNSRPGGFPGFPPGFTGFPPGFSGFPPGFSGFPPGFSGFPPGFQPSNIIIENIEIKLSVSLDQVYKQENVSISYLFQKYCEDCEGKGGLLEDCNDCNGKGNKMYIQRIGNMISQTIVNCEKCKGKGKNLKNNCNKCDGKGKNYLTRNINFSLSKNLENGNKIQVKSEGNYYLNQKSDLIINIEILPHNIFKIKNKDLIMNVEISLLEALFGFNKKIKYIDDTYIDIESTSVTQYNYVSCIEGKGMTEKHNLFIIYTFTLPLIKKECEEILKDIFVDEKSVKIPKNNNDIIIYFNTN